MRNFPHGSCAKELILNESSWFKHGTIVALIKVLLMTVCARWQAFKETPGQAVEDHYVGKTK